MLANPEEQISSSMILRREIAGALVCNAGLAGGARSADPPINHGTLLATAFSTYGRGLASRHTLWVGGKLGKASVPAFRKLAVLYAEQFFGEVWVVSAMVIDLREPIVAQPLAPLPDALTEVIVDALPARKISYLVPTRSFVWLAGAGSPPRPEVRRGPRWCLVCWERRIRCGCPR